MGRSANCPSPHRARVRFSAPARVLTELVPPTAAVIEELDESACLLSAGSDSLDALAVHLALTGLPFEVLDPPELIEHLRTLSERLTRAAP